MKFTDYTLLGGRIHSRRDQDTADTPAAGIEMCRYLLHQLRAGETKLQYSMNPGEQATGAASSASPLPIELRLGLPDEVAAGNDRLSRDMEAPGRFFTIGAPGSTVPFQINLVLPQSASGDRDQRAIATLIGLSGAVTGMNLSEIGRDATLEMIGDMWESRPLLATALMPTDGLTPELVQYAASFSTAFAATLLLEEADELPASPAEYHRNTDVNRLFFAINHYVSTGDHIGEGMAFPDGAQFLQLAVPYRPGRPVDANDFRLFQLRLEEIGTEGGPRTTWIDKGTHGDMRIMLFRLRADRVESLTKHLMSKPSRRGWGSNKAVIDRSFPDGMPT